MTARITIQILFVASLLFAAPQPAMAADEGIIEVAVGSGVNVAASRDADVERVVNIGFNARLKLLHILAVDVAWTPPRDVADNVDLATTATWRLNALLYLMNFDHFGLYMGGGFGAEDPGDLVYFRGDTTWYRLGGGFEVVSNRHLALTAEGFWTVPGLTMTEQKLNENFSDIREASPSDLLELSRFEVFVGFRIWL